MYKFANTYVERDKKNFKLAVFGVQLPVLLIEIVSHEEFLDRITGFFVEQG